jgi:hypothetical protein
MIDYYTTTLGWIAAIMPITPPPGTVTGTVRDASTMNAVSGVNVWTDTSYAVSDSLGKYTLKYVPTGTSELTGVAVVNASAIGYQQYKNSGVVIVSDATTTLNIYITPDASIAGQITGTIYHTTPTDWIKGAKVHEENSNTNAYTDTAGKYTLYNIPVGTYRLDVTADNYKSVSAEGYLSAAETKTQNFQLSTVVKKHYSFDFEATGTLEGFVALPPFDGQFRNMWHVQEADLSPNPLNYFNATQEGNPRKVMLPDDGYLPADDPSGGSGSYYLWCGMATSEVGMPTSVVPDASYIGKQLTAYNETSEALTGGFSYGDMTMTHTVESPEIDLTGYIRGTLDFSTWWEVEGINPATGHDRMAVYMSKSPYTQWTLLTYLNPYSDPYQGLSYEAYTSGGYNIAPEWIDHKIDITSFTGYKTKVKFEFYLGDTHFNAFRGWIIDNISVSSEVSGTLSKLNRSYVPLKR